MLSDRDTINKFGLQIKQALLDQGTPQEKEGSSLEAGPVTLDDVQKRVDQMEDALVVRESLDNLEGQGQSGDVAAILSDQQIKALQSSRNLADAGVTASQKQQLIQSIVSRHEERPEEHSPKQAGQQVPAAQNAADQDKEGNPFAGKFNEHVTNASLLQVRRAP